HVGRRGALAAEKLGVEEAGEGLRPGAADHGVAQEAGLEDRAMLAEAGLAEGEGIGVPGEGLADPGQAEVPGWEREGGGHRGSICGCGFADLPDCCCSLAGPGYVDDTRLMELTVGKRSGCRGAGGTGWAPGASVD